MNTLHSGSPPPLLARCFYRVAVDLAADRTPIEPQPLCTRSTGEKPLYSHSRFSWRILRTSWSRSTLLSLSLSLSSYDDDDLNAPRLSINFLLPANLLTSPPPIFNSHICASQIVCIKLYVVGGNFNLEKFPIFLRCWLILTAAIWKLYFIFENCAFRNCVVQLSNLL